MEKMTFAALASKTIKISTNDVWSVTQSPSWVSVVPLSGVDGDNQLIEIQLLENNPYTQLRGDIIVFETINGARLNLIVEQYGNKAVSTISITPISAEVGGVL